MPIKTELPTEEPQRPILQAMKHGWRQRCPACGAGRIFKSYLKVNDACPKCGEELHHQRADDAPPYFTMLIVGHIFIVGILWMEKAFAPPSWVQFAVWLPVLIGSSLWMLPRVKGALIAYQWACRMHGFGGEQVEGADIPPAEPRPST